MPRSRHKAPLRSTSRQDVSSAEFVIKRSIDEKGR
jgi:hypothetical protein